MVHRPVGDASEQWRPIRGYENLYSVSSLGSVINNRTGYILSPYPGNRGYLKVTLYKDKRQAVTLVHHCVSDAFLGPLHSGYVVNHINLNKHDNRATNLEHVSQRENAHHYWHTIRSADERNKIISFIRENWERLGISAISKQLGMKYCTVYSIAKQRRWSDGRCEYSRN